MVYYIHYTWYIIYTIHGILYTLYVVYYIHSTWYIIYPITSIIHPIHGIFPIIHYREYTMYRVW